MYAYVNEKYVLPLMKVTVSEHSLFVTTIHGSHGPENQLQTKQFRVGNGGHQNYVVNCPEILYSKVNSFNKPSTKAKARSCSLLDF